MRIAVFCLIALSATALAACGGSSDKPSATPNVPAAAASASAPATTITSAPSATPSTAATAPPATPAATATTAPSPTAAATPAATQPPQPTAPPPTATPPPSSGLPTSASIGVTGTASFFFSPAAVTIAVGGSVSFSWSGNDYHDVSPVGGNSLAGCETTKTGSCSQTFSSAGVYHFICIVHPDTMKETVTVQ